MLSVTFFRKWDEILAVTREFRSYTQSIGILHSNNNNINNIMIIIGTAPVDWMFILLEMVLRAQSAFSQLIWRYWSTYSSLILQMKRCRHKKLYNLLLRNGETGVQTQAHEIIQPRILNTVHTIILLNSLRKKKKSARYCLLTHPGLWVQEKEWAQEAAPGIEI